MILVFGKGQLGQELGLLAARRGVSLATLAHADVDIGDSNAVAKVIMAHSPALVVNAAAYTKVDAAESEPERALRANVIGPTNIAAACARIDRPLIHISTDYVFDGTKTTAYVEDDPIAPLSVYGHSKAEGEAAIRASGAQHVILRSSWIYGAHGANFLKTILRLSVELKELRIVADQRGCPTATIDLAEAILVVATRLYGDTAISGTFHFAGRGETSWHGFASAIVNAQARFTGRLPIVIPIPSIEYSTPAQRPANSALDCARFTETFGLAAAPWQDRTQQVVAELLQ